jgi:hypothetical protein
MALKLSSLPPKIQALARAAGVAPDKGKAKYGNTRTQVDGQWFDSAKEARRVSTLKQLERAGVIRDLVLQREFPLVVTNIDTGAETIVGAYRADADYIIVDPRRAPVIGRKAGDWIVEDVKSEATAGNAVYRLKKKIVAARHGVEVVEV